MALNLLMQLARSEGLNRIVVFTGLSHPIVIHPTVHGEPLLTAQAFYYLDQLESVAHVRYEGHPLPPDQLDYLVDNYIFEYSKRHPQSRLTSRVSSSRYWEDDPSDFYLWSDGQLTERLAIDSLNDKSVMSIAPADPEDGVDLSDWDIARTYVNDAFQEYQMQLAQAIRKKVRLVKAPSALQDGYMGYLRVIKPGYGLVDFGQATRLESLSFDDVENVGATVPLGESISPNALHDLPVERVSATKQYNPVLLGYFFGALKEDTPLRSFVGFYNVLEYYFEEVPLLLSRVAATELEQLKLVVQWLVSDAEVGAALGTLSAADQTKLAAPLKTSSGVDIAPLDRSAANLREELARWLYAIRCAVVHSKKTRKGRPTPTFQPYSIQAQGLAPSIPLLRWLSVLCIEKDEALGFS